MNRSLSPQFSDLDWDAFQSLCVDLLAKQDGVDRADVYGVQGQSQRGIDILAYRTDGRMDVGQCKKYREAKKALIVSATKEFWPHLTHWQGHAVGRFILFIACDITDTAVQDEILTQTKNFRARGLGYEVWGAAILRQKLQGHPEIVFRHTGSVEVTENICGRPIAPLTLSEPLTLKGAPNSTDAKLNQLMDMVQGLAAEKPADSLAASIAGAIEQLNRDSDYFRFELQVGRDIIKARPGSFGVQKVDIPGTGEEIAVHFFEKEPGALEKFQPKIEFCLEFPDTEEGKIALQSYKNIFERGDSFELDAKYIKDFKTNLPSPLNASKSDVPQLISLLIEPQVGRDTHPCKLQVLDPGGGVLAEVGYIPLNEIRSGSKQVTFSSKGANQPFELDIVFKVEDDTISEIGSFYFNLQPGNHTLMALKPYIELVDNFKKGNQFRIEHLLHGPLTTGRLNSNPPNKNNDLMRLLRALLIACELTGQDMLIPELGAFTEQDIKNIESYLENYEVSYKMDEISFTADRQLIENLAGVPEITKQQFSFRGFNYPMEFFRGKSHLYLGTFSIEVPGAVFKGIDFGALLAQDLPSYEVVNKLKRPITAKRVYQKPQL